MKKLVCFCLICWGLAPSAAMAQSSSNITLRVMVALEGDKTKPNPLEDPKKAKKIADQKRENRRLKRKQLALAASKRIKRRLYAAGVKSARVVPKRHGEIEIKVVGKYDKSWLTSIVVPRGSLGVHPRKEAGQWWKDLRADLPKTIKLIQPAGEDASKAFLWSADANLLRGYLKRISLPSVQLGVLPHNKGWRSVVYTAPILNEGFLAQATETTSKTGRPFVALSFKSKSQAVWATQTASSYVVVLDGEVLSSFAKPSASTVLQLKLMCPGVQVLKAQRACVRQITGRLAAPIPIKLVVLK